jgi:dTDP-4-amino-4,6-dideoxygalactose transaminase
LDALTLSLQVAGVGPGDDVLVPAHTFIATWLAVHQCGATPIPVEPASGSFNIDTAGVAAALTPRTRAVIPVHLYGEPADALGLAELCRTRRLLLVEDAAQAHGALHQGRPAGSFGTLAAFSFYPGKNLGAFGDGGAVVTDDETLAAALRERRNYGSLGRYEHRSAGVNSRLDELQAAWLHIRLERLAAHNDRRRAIARRYAERLADIPGLKLPVARLDNEPVWHLYVVRCAQRNALQTHLTAHGIATLIHYPRPVYRYAPFLVHGPTERSVSDPIRPNGIPDRRMARCRTDFIWRPNRRALWMCPESRVRARLSRGPRTCHTRTSTTGLRRSFAVGIAA